MGESGKNLLLFYIFRTFGLGISRKTFREGYIFVVTLNGGKVPGIELDVCLTKSRPRTISGKREVLLVLLHEFENILLAGEGLPALVWILVGYGTFGSVHDLVVRGVHFRKDVESTSRTWK